MTTEVLVLTRDILDRVVELLDEAGPVLKDAELAKDCDELSQTLTLALRHNAGVMVE